MKIAQLRKEKCISQKKIADLLCITVRTLQNWESGRTQPEINEILKLADYFEVTTDYLLGRESESGTISVSRGLTQIQEEVLFYFDKLTLMGQREVIGFTKALIIN